MTIQHSIFLLTSLKRSLVHLYICANARIDDAAIPPVLLLSKLSFLSISDTCIGMDGLRLFFATLSREFRFITTEIPLSCEQYLDSEGSRFFILLSGS